MSINESGIPNLNRSTNDQESHEIKRLKLWQIDAFFKCPIIGTCLTLAEQKQIFKKIGLSSKKKSPYDMHEIFVANSDSDNRIARKVDGLLNRKYGRKASVLLALDNQSFMARFNAAFQGGEDGTHIWAAAVKPDLSVEFKREIFGSLHMAMHANSEERTREKNKLSKNRKELDLLRQKLKETARQSRMLQKNKRELEIERDALKAAFVAQTERKTQLEDTTASSSGCDISYSEDLKRDNRLWKEEANTALKQLEQKERQLAAANVENLGLSSELKRQADLNQRLKEEMPQLLGALKALTRCESSCASFNLCKKRILIVGGITRMETLYRDLIEGSGGIFEYHDGYMKRGVKGLETRLKRADMVICPVSCNSHAACSIVKNLAKKHKKRVHMLANSSLSSLSQVIWAVENTSSGANNRQIQ